MMARKRLLALGVLLAATAAYALVGRRPAYAVPAHARTARVERGSIARSVVATGKVEPISKVEIKSKANGIIERLLVDTGDTVEAGQVLAELDRQMLEAGLREARASLRGMEARQVSAEAQLAKSRLEAEAPDVEFTRRALARARQLFEQQLVPASSLDDAQSAWEMAAQRQRTAQGQLAVARANLAEAAANVEQARAIVERTDEELRNATIRAPIRGTVLSLDVAVGSAVSSILNLGSAATLVMTLGNIDGVFVRGKVNEVDVGRITVGLPALITVETFRDRQFKGVVTKIAPIGVEWDNVTTFQVEASIASGADVLKANMTANAEILLDEYRDVLLVPEAAISYDAQRAATVDVVTPSDPRGRRTVPVTLGVNNGLRTHVLSGVKEGDELLLPDS